MVGLINDPDLIESEEIPPNLSEQVYLQNARDSKISIENYIYLLGDLQSKDSWPI